MSELARDLEQARRFLAALHGEENPLVCWQTFADREEDKKDDRRKGELAALRHLRAAAAMSWATALNDQLAGVYCCINRTDGQGRLNASIVGLRAVFVDCDGTSELPDAWPLAPSIVVRRDATHWHAYWLLEPTEASALARFTPAQVQLAAHWGTDKAIKDLPRVMRIPGFWHCKGEPMAVQLVRCVPELRYTIDQVLEAHPVDWDAAAVEPYRKAAEAAGLLARATPPVPLPGPGAVAAPRRAGRADDYTRLLDMTRAWMLKMDTHAGSTSARGGIDNSTFELLCKCVARNIHEHDARGLAEDYWRRSGASHGPADFERLWRSASSKPRSDTLPVVMTERRGDDRRARLASPAAAAAKEDIFGSPPADAGEGAAVPPAPPSGDDGSGGAGGGDNLHPWERDLDMPLIVQRWEISSLGVWPIEIDQNGEWKRRPNKRLADLPVWPVQQGYDVATGNAYWRVAWMTPKRDRREQWLGELDMKTGPALVALSDGPVTKKTCEGAAQWLTAARVAVKASACKVTSRLGWCGTGDARRWVWPSGGEDGVQYIGSELGEVGAVEAWRAGLDHLAQLEGDRNRPGLVVLGFAAGTGFSRIAGRRNPIIGCMGTSSTGKGSIIDYALSIWGRVDGMRVPASSTAKGLQDLAAGIPDLPVLLDEFQQLAEAYPNQAADALYYLANGQRRVTSGKDQKAKGGERRYGCGFYAAEAPVLGGMNTGVHFRVIELTDLPFCDSKETAELLQRCTKEGGALATQLAQHINATPAAEWKAILHRYGIEWQAVVARDKGDDATALAILQAGLEALGAVLDVDLQPKAVCTWLAGLLAQQRRATADREAIALHALFDSVLNGHWMEEDGAKGKRMDVQKGRDGLLVAWRTLVTDETVWEKPAEGQSAVDVGTDGEVKRYRVGALDVNSQAPEPMRVLNLYGGEQRLLGSWAKRGWIQPDPDGRHLKVKKWHGNAPVGRVVRFSAAGLQAYYDWAPPVA